MVEPKLLGTERYCRDLLETVNEIKDTKLLGFGFFIDDLAYNVRNKEYIENDKEVYKLVRDKIFDLKGTLEQILKDCK